MSIVRPYDRNALREQFQSAEPYPHFVIDDFLEAAFAREVAASYPTYREAQGIGFQFDALNEKAKIQVTDSMKFPAPVLKLHEFLASPQFLDDMSFITGIPRLLADSQLMGGGMHMTGPGGRLDVHIDFNYDAKRAYHRRLNILIYLNDHWEKDWGGQLELWDKDVRQCHRVVEPELNRCVVFETSEISYHGVRPIKRSAGKVRQSFAAYYYTLEPPAHWSGQNHTTVFKSRPDEFVRGHILMPVRRAGNLTLAGIHRAKRFVRKILLGAR